MATTAVLDVLFRGDVSGLEKSFSGVDAAVTSVGKKAQAAGDQVKQAFSSFGGEKIASEAAAAAKGVAEIGGASKLTEKELAGVAATVAEAVAKFEALGKEVPADIAALSQEIANLGKTVDETGGRFDKLSGGLHNIGTASLGAAGVAVGAIAGIGAGLAAVGALGAAWLSVSSEIDQSQRDLQAQLGMSEEFAKSLGEVGQDVFKNNWGESIGDATKAVGLFAKAFDFDIPQDQLKEVTEQAFALQGAFEIDTADSATAVGILSTAFGDVAADGTKALDQIMTVMQNTGGNSDDLLETIGEYSPLFKQLGFDSEQFFGVLQSGLQAGARDTDYVADAIKEFGIRITDNSKSTNEALSNLGLDGLGEQVRSGMTTGADAFQMIQDKLAELPPDMRAAEGAVALFGTKFEDLGPEIFAALSTDPLTNFEGAAMDAGNAASASIGGAFEGLKRSAMLALAGIGGGEAFGAFKDRAIEAINLVSGSLSSLADGDVWAFIGEIGMAIEAFTGLTGLGDAFDAFGKRVQEAMDYAQRAFGWFMEGFNADPDMSFIERIREGIGGLAAFFGAEKGASMGEFFASVGTAVDSFMQGVNDAKPGVEAFVNAMVERFNYFKDEILPIIKDSVMPVISSMVESLGTGFKIAAPIVTMLAAKLMEFGNVLIETVWPILKPVFEFIGENSKVFALLAGVIMMVVGGPITMLVGALIAIGAAVPPLLAAWDSFKAKLEEIGAATNAKIAEWQAGWRGFKDGVAASWQAMKDSISEAIQSARDTIDNVQQSIQDKIGAAQDWILDKIHEVWNAIPEDIRNDLILIANHVSEKWEEFKTTIATKSAEIVAMVAEKFAAVRDAIVGPLEEFIAAAGIKWDQFKAATDQAMQGIRDIAVSAFMALVAAWDTHVQPIVDKAKAVFDSVKNAVTEKINAVVTAIRDALGRGKTEAEKKASEIKDGMLKPLTEAIAKVKGIGSDIITGLIKALNDGKTAVKEALLSMVRGGLDAVKDFLGIASPSKVFAQIGEWITIGLASGIQKADQKAVAALADVIGKMVSVSNGLADFGKKIADMIVPSDQQIAAAKEKYLRMTMILTDFIKSISYLGALLPVANVSKAEPGQVRAINAGLTQLSQSFPAIRELQGMTADKLLTGGEASWASMLADTVGKISGVWGGIADSMTKIATAKFPTDAQLQSIKESTIRIATWAMGVLDQPMITSLGAEEFAKAIKGVVDALATVAGLALDKIAAVTDTQLQIAGASLTSLATWAKAMMEDWLTIMPDAKVRAEFVGQLQEFATMIKSAADIVKSADIGDLSKMVVLQVTSFGPVKDSLGRMQQLTTEIVQAWAKGAGDATARAQWITDLKDFADTMGAAADILKIAAIGEIKAALEYNADALTDVLTRLRDQLQPAMAAIVAAWTLTNEQAAVATERMQAFGNWIGAALSLAKLADVGKLVGEVELDVIEIRAVLKWVRDNLAPEMAMVADAWKVVSEEAERQTARMKEFGDWISASIGLAKLADVGTLNGEVELDVIELRAVLKWVRDRLAPEMVMVADAWATASKEAERQTARMKEFSDWISASIGMAKLANVGTLVGEVELDVIEIRAVLKWVRDKLAPEMVAIAEAWGHTAESSKPIIEKMQAFGAFVAAAVSLAKSADLSELTTVTGVSGLAGKLEIVKTNILAMYGMLGEIAKDIGVEEANARAALATALGGIGGGLGDFGGGIGGIMELVQSKLFGSDASRGGLGFTQRTKTNRADFFATQLTDTVKRAVGAVQDALDGISIQPNDPKVTALGQLGEAFGKLADGLTKLAEAKLPDAGQLAAIMGATGGASLALAGAAGGGGGAGPTVTGMGGGDMYIQYGNNVIVTDADDQQGLIEALKASIR